MINKYTYAWWIHECVVDIEILLELNNLSNNNSSSTKNQEIRL